MMDDIDCGWFVDKGLVGDSVIFVVVVDVMVDCEC